MFSEFLTSRLSLFYLTIEKGKKEFLKYLCMILSKGILSQCLVLWNLNLVEIISNRRWGDLFFKIWWNGQSFLNQLLLWKDSKPNSWLIFSEGDTLISLSNTLYCQSSILLNRIKFFVKRRLVNLVINNISVVEMTTDACLINSK